MPWPGLGRFDADQYYAWMQTICHEALLTPGQSHEAGGDDVSSPRSREEGQGEGEMTMKSRTFNPKTTLTPSPSPAVPEGLPGGYAGEESFLRLPCR
ncbi:protein of unknown function [Georgfuchsia toluolica]|uniref:Uncharacterized protein n=1 Tax=Georgfuchsia toluolica TaxID=424218 RepID=A0A916J2Q5_9PROT|nr:protein of unknown function [Georgfuchsia toluolica]